MVRTQIQLTESQAAALRRRASERGTSIAQLIREGIETALMLDKAADGRNRALRAVGRFSSGKHDVSVQHDSYLAEDLQ
jgi:Ribbon-helix-helix protein, copG family